MDIFNWPRNWLNQVQIWIFKTPMEGMLWNSNIYISIYWSWDISSIDISIFLLQVVSTIGNYVQLSGVCNSSYRTWCINQSDWWIIYVRWIYIFISFLTNFQKFVSDYVRRSAFDWALFTNYQNVSELLKKYNASMTSE